MRPKRQESPARARQQTPQEVRDALLELVQRKFYEGDWIGFQKEQKDLLRWVILWPASWLNERGVTVPPERYREIVSQVLITAAAFQRGKIKYRPAYLRHVVQSHFAHHGEEIYGAAKAARSVAEHALMTLGKLPVATPDRLVPEFTAAARLLERRKPRLTVPKSDVKEQLSLL